MLALVFPGQGSQAVGMGQALAEAFAPARHVFAEIDDALGQDLSGLMRDGPADALNLTANAQPALLAVSMAALRVLQTEIGLDISGQACCVAGHSLGEYSALAAAGSFGIGDAARLLRIRGEAMQRSIPVGEGAMAALIGLDLERSQAVAREAAGSDVCDVANDNGAGQVVVSGHAAAVARAVAIAPRYGAKRAVMLAVSAPFHCALMAPAAEIMREALAGAALQAPAVPVMANVEAAPLRDVGAIRAALVRQVTGTVRWRECVLAAEALGAITFIEIGAGKVLSGLVKRIATSAGTAHFGQPSDLDGVRAVA